ncbi:MAG: polysaccharide deacetylase family protein [Ferruginibacter sp.]|nr:polysaccharide deacetylase family protein [Ferruginibacter sp.]
MPAFFISMLLLYTNHISPRLVYITSFMLGDLLGMQIKLTTNVDDHLRHSGAKINYSDQQLHGDGLQVIPHGLLFEKTIQPQQVDCLFFKEQVAFFKTGGPDLFFDVFAAAFYLLSRYEEYLPHKKDMYGRFAHEESLAFQNGFLDQPLINHWALQLGYFIQQKFPETKIKMPAFKFLPTYDIDIAFSFKHKGLLRSIGGSLKSPTLKRFLVLAGMKPDPYDAFEWMDDLHAQHKLQPRYFFLLAEKNSRYDKHILPRKKALRQLVQRLSTKYPIAIHPSWQSGDDPQLLESELKQLELISGQQVSHSRQHYIRFNLPDGYRRLINEGVTDDYSMGYGSINGFRASTASPFFWYDLEREETTELRIHPFCFMEANSFYEQQLGAAEACAELKKYARVCQRVGGTMITIWHNHFLGTEARFESYRDMYKKFIEEGFE